MRRRLRTRDGALAVCTLANGRRMQARVGRQAWLGASHVVPLGTEGRPTELEQRGRIAGLGEQCDGRGRLPCPSDAARVRREARRTSGVGIQPGTPAGSRPLHGTRHTAQRQHGQSACAHGDLADRGAASAGAGSQSRLGQRLLLLGLTEGRSHVLPRRVLRV